MPDTSNKNSSLIPLIGAGISAAGTAIGGLFTGKANKATREYNTQMYERQRQDALADYAMQNDYNSPAATMERLQKAGLNPNLAYGSGATTQAAPVRSASPGNYKAEAPRIDTSSITNSLSGYYDIQLRQAQTDNLKKTQEVANHQIAYLDAQTLAALSGTNKNDAQTALARQNFDQSAKLFPISLEGAEVSVKKAYSEIEKNKANTQFTNDQNIRNSLLTTKSLEKTTQDMLTQQAQNSKIPYEIQAIQANIANLKKTGILQDLEIQLERLGLDKNSPEYLKIIKRVVDNPTQAGQFVDKALKELSRISGRDALWKWIRSL